MVTIPTHEALSDSRPDGAEQVSTLMQLLVKGLRAVQLYLPNNPVYQRAMENLAAAFPPVWEYTDELELTVHETELLWDNEPVLSQDSKSESVAWLLFKDGVRTLTIHRGAEDEEIGRLMQVIQRARTLEQDAPDDLLTLLLEDVHDIVGSAAGGADEHELHGPRPRVPPSRGGRSGPNSSG